MKPDDPYVQLAFRAMRIRRVVTEAPAIRSFYLEYAGDPPSPGQFFMVWVPGREEIPLSASGLEEGLLRLTVKAVGGTTRFLMKLGKGDSLLLRGPFGRGFSLENFREVMAVGGGYGAAPLIYALRLLRRENKKCWYIVGAKRAEELLFVEEAKRIGARVEVATEDGSAGHRGLVTELLDRLLDSVRPDCIITCGPEGMMKKVLEVAMKRNIPVQASLERYMKCGFGICGSCVLDPAGLRVCKDGPVFSGEELLQTDFGKFKRDASGRRVAV